MAIGDASVEDTARGSVARVRSLRRAIVGLSIAAVSFPAAIFGLIERNARRIDALAERGREVVAVVTRADPSIVHYAYVVEGEEHSWNFSADGVIHLVGAPIRVLVLPDVPSFSRPLTGRSALVAEAAKARRIGRVGSFGVGLVLLLIALVAYLDLRRLRRGAPSELDDPAAYRRRIVRMGFVFLIPLTGLTWFHASDARERGQSALPAFLGAGFVLAILGTIGWLAYRDGPAVAALRARRIARWVVPAAIGIALIRALIWFAAL